MPSKKLTGQSILRRRGLHALAVLTIVFPLAAPAAPSDNGYSNYVELRVYPVDPNRQQRFLDYFEEHYLESQEVAGMRIWGQFRDLDAPERFVWLRGFRSMSERLAGLQQFYGSPVWAETGGEAVSMLTGRARHVHFLEPVAAGTGFDPHHRRPLLVAETADDLSTGVIVIEVYPFVDSPDDTVELLRATALPRVERSGGELLALLRSSNEANDFPLLPFIEDEPVVVVVASFPGRRAADLASPPAAQAPTLLERFVLEPGPRSRIRHRQPQRADDHPTTEEQRHD